MAPPRVKALVAVVVLFAIVQVALEEVLVFLDVVGAVPGAGSYVVMVAVPLLVAGLLLAVLVGAALRSADTLR